MEPHPVESRNTKKVEISCTDLQYAAITSELYNVPDSLLNIIAGPGSGKTRTMVSRIAYILSSQSPGNVNPSEILVLSMTNRSVNDLKVRMQQLLDQDLVNQIPIMTFHSFAGNIINTKYEDWQILEEEEIKRLSELITSNKKAPFTVNTFKSLIRESRRVTDLENYENSALFQKYGLSKESLMKLRELIGSHLFTYEDMLTECNRILETSPPDFIGNYKAIFVDEFQDVYPALTEIITHTSKDKHLTIAGDPNQSIYGFLGARFSKNWGKIVPLYPEERKNTIVLNQSFRSTPELLELSTRVLGKHLTNMHTSVKTSNLIPPVRMSFSSQYEEFEFIHNEIKRLIEVSHGEIKPSDIAILSFTNKEVDSVFNFFKEKGDLQLSRLTSTPAWLKTQLSFILQYIKILIDPRQNFPLLSCLSLLHGVGLSALNTIYLDSLKNDVCVWDYLKDPSIKKPAKITKTTQEFVGYISECRQTIEPNNPDSIILTLLNIGTKFGLKKRIQSAKLSQTQLEEYNNYLKSFHKSLQKTLKFKPKDQTLLRYYLNNYNSELLLNPNSNLTRLYNDSEVNFSTIHTAKGLEFPVVFILSSNNFNLSSAERRKVLYVGMTRASSLLYFNKLDNQFVSNIDQPADTTAPIFDSKPPNLMKFPNLLRLLSDMGKDTAFLSKTQGSYVRNLQLLSGLGRKITHH